MPRLNGEPEPKTLHVSQCIRILCTWMFCLMELADKWTMYSDADGDILYGQVRRFQSLALTLRKVSFVREKIP